MPNDKTTKTYDLSFDVIEKIERLAQLTGRKYYDIIEVAIRVLPDDPISFTKIALKAAAEQEATT